MQTQSVIPTIKVDDHHRDGEEGIRELMTYHDVGTDDAASAMAFRKAKHLKSWKTKDPSVVSASSSQVSIRSLARLDPSYYYSGLRRNAIACYRELVHATLVCMFPNITGNSIFHRWPSSCLVVIDEYSRCTEEGGRS